MAMHIDMNPALQVSKYLQRGLKVLSGERFHLSRVCVHATVFHAPEAATTVGFRRSVMAAVDLLEDAASWREAVDWQADPDDEVEDWQVHRNLQRVAATNTSGYSEFCLKNNLPTIATTTLTASTEIPAVSTLAHRPLAALSSFRRHSFRVVRFAFSFSGSCFFSFPSIAFTNEDALNNQLGARIPDIHSSMLVFKLRAVVKAPHRVGYAVIQTQFDVVDLFSVVHPPPLCRGKRRRGPLDPILHEPPPQLQEHTSERANHAKRAPFNGVRERVRARRKVWVAEIRQDRDKDWIGEFKSEAQAARAVDAAHYYYGRTDLLNFADAPQLLSARPAPAAPPLTDEQEWLRFVKQEAKWLASIPPSRPSSPSARASLEIVESSRDRVAATFEFRSFSEIVAEPAIESANEVDDAASQLQHSNILMPDSGANWIQTMDHDTGAAIESLNPEDFPFLRAIDTKDKFQMVQDYLLRSPSPAPVLQTENRPDWQVNVEELLLEETEEIWGLIEQ